MSQFEEVKDAATKTTTSPTTNSVQTSSVALGGSYGHLAGKVSPEDHQKLVALNFVFYLEIVLLLIAFFLFIRMCIIWNRYRNSLNPPKRFYVTNKKRE